MTTGRTTDDAEDLGEPLPAAVRERLVAVAADALGDLPIEQVPAGLVRIARFAKARRARLGAVPIATTLDADPVFRRRIADRVGASMPELLDAVRGAAVGPAVDPVEAAVLAYLDRPHGWTGLVAAAQPGEGQAAPAQETMRELDRLRRQLAAEQQSSLVNRERSRTELARLREDNATLRRTVHDLRTQLREVGSQRDDAVAEARSAGDRVDQARSVGEAEARRLRASVADLEGRLEAAHRAVRADRTTATATQRILLDTVIDAAAGLRRELALPVSDVRPADAVVETLRSATQQRARALDGADAESVEAVLTLPGLHLVLDGYNVTRLAWDAHPLEAQRRRLVEGLGPFVARLRAEVTVVFDGTDMAHPPQVAAPRGVRVVFSPAGETADEVVRRLVAAEPVGRAVLVVSTDQEVVEGVLASGAWVLPSARFLGLLGTR